MHNYKINNFFLDQIKTRWYFWIMGMAKQIRLLLVKQGNTTEAELARKLRTSPANFYQKMKRDNFSEKELREIGDVLGCDVKIIFVDRQTWEET
jgi:hypothetical protein